MRYHLCVVFLAIAFCGCQEAQLRDRTVRLATTTDDLFYQQVLDNTALLIDDPNALPYFTGPTQGTAQIQRTLTTSYTPSWDFITSAGRYLGRYLFDKQSAMIQGSQINVESWQTTPTDNPDKLVLMRCAYLKATGGPCDDCEGILYRFYKKRRMVDVKKDDGDNAPVVNYYNYLGAGWFAVGKKCDVPKDVCYVGHHCDTYVWVDRQHMGDFSRFTLAILDIYTYADTTHAKPGFYDLLDLFNYPEGATPREKPVPYPAPPAIAPPN